MIVILELIVLGVLLLVLVQYLTGRSGGGGKVTDQSARHAEIDDDRPAQAAAATLREFENARAALKGRYPAVFSMLAGYLNAHTLSETGGLEAAVREMIADWTPRREEVSRELTRLLAELDTEEEARAFVVSACEATFDEEGYRAWLAWLLSRFNAA